MDKEFWELYNLLLEDEPQKSEAVIWLQGDRHDRAKKVLEIYDSNLAGMIVITGNNILIGQGTRPGEENISLVEMKDYLLKNRVKKKDIIIDDGALNTKDQAVHIINLARNKNWKKIILVSSAYNQPRAWLTFLKQMELTGTNLDIYNQPVLMKLDAIPGGRQETVESLVGDEIEKIKNYASDVSVIRSGINYLENRKKI